MNNGVAVRHNFETAHRLPFLGGKCTNLHGHSWWVEVEVSASEAREVVCEFGALKAGLRGWIDQHLDHGAMLGHEDPLAEVLEPYGKVYTFGRDEFSEGLSWPTVENVATLLSRVSASLIGGGEGLQVSRVEVQETAVNKAVWG